MLLEHPHRQLAPQRFEGGPAHPVLTPRDRRRGDQRLTGHRVSPEQQIADRVGGEVVGVIAIGMAARDAEDPLADQFHQRVPDLPGFPPVDQMASEARQQPVHALRRLMQDGAAIGTRMLAIECRDQGRIDEIWEQDSLWYRFGCHVGASVVDKRLSLQRLYQAGAIVFLSKTNLHK